MKCSAARPSTQLVLPLFKCLTEFVMLATETLQENSVILVNSLDSGESRGGGGLPPPPRNA